MRLIDFVAKLISVFLSFIDNRIEIFMEVLSTDCNEIVGSFFDILPFMFGILWYLCWLPFWYFALYEPTSFFNTRFYVSSNTCEHFV